jgi:hypothetical protein
MPCNWKFAAENFAGDYYHNPSHASVDAVRLSPSGKTGRHTYDPVTQAHAVHKLNISVAPQGHTARGELFQDDYPYLPTYGEMPIVEEWFRACYEQRQAKLGERARWFGHGGTIFPNVSYSNGVQSMGTWHPNGPHETEIWRIFLVPKDAPDEVRSGAAILSTTRWASATSAPAGPSLGSGAASASPRTSPSRTSAPSTAAGRS